MLKKIKKGVKRVMKETSDIVKYVVKSLSSRQSRLNAGIIIIGLGVGLGGGLIVSAFARVDEEGKYYVEEN